MHGNSKDTRHKCNSQTCLSSACLHWKTIENSTLEWKNVFCVLCILLVCSPVVFHQVKMWWNWNANGFVYLSDHHYLGRTHRRGQAAVSIPFRWVTKITSRTFLSKCTWSFLLIQLFFSHPNVPVVCEHVWKEKWRMVYFCLLSSSSGRGLAEQQHVCILQHRHVYSRV